SPAYEIWGDSKWAEFYIYDLYTGLGLRRHAKHVHRRFSGNRDDFPRRGTRWFRDWFYPLWRDCGQAAVMARFFGQLAQHFPCDADGTYTRRMNWGEYVHFTSTPRAPTCTIRPPAPSAGPASGPTSSSWPASSSPASPTKARQTGTKIANPELSAVLSRARGWRSCFRGNNNGVSVADVTPRADPAPLRSALTAATHGWHVFPCAAGGKR